MRKLISKLRSHPKNKDIYGDAEAGQVDDLITSIEEVGLLHPPVITPEGFVISGHRRLAALREMGRKYVECEVVDVSQQNELLYLIHANFQRQKTPIQLLNEILLLEDLWGKKQGERTNIEDDTSLKKHGFKSTRDRIAKTLKISPATINKLKFIHKIEPELFKELGHNGTLTISAAFSQCKMRENQKRIIQDKENDLGEERNGIIGVDQQWHLFPKSCLRMHEDLDENSVDIVFFSPPYWNMGRQYTGQDNELGCEKSADEYIKNIIKITNKCRKHLKSTGSMFINVGDTFQNKSRSLVPERLTIALNDTKPKWHVVQTLIWDKANTAIPEGQVKRFNSSYEEIIWCVKDPKNYYFDPDQIREPYKTKGATTGKPPRRHEKPAKSKSKRGSDDKIVRGYSYRWNKNVSSSLKHPLGKMKRDILRVNRATTQSIDFGENVKHTSIMPVELVDTILAGVIRPGMLVVDPTMGSGTTGVSALGFGAYFCGYDPNNSFCELANHRLEQRVHELMEE